MSFQGCRVYFVAFIIFLMENTQSDLGLHCLPTTLLRISRYECVKGRHAKLFHP